MGEIPFRKIADFTETVTTYPMDLGEGARIKLVLRTMCPLCYLLARRKASHSPGEMLKICGRCAVAIEEPAIDAIQHDELPELNADISTQQRWLKPPTSEDKYTA